MKLNPKGKSLRARLPLLAGSLLLAFAPTFGNASGLQNQLNGLFDGMTNYTPPGVYETQRRGVFSGGRFTAKSRIFQENLVNFTPPSWKGGCGGIDFFGGAFSFINAEQLVQLLRAIAANAKGYAFQLALDNLCKECMTIMENLAKKIQELNQYMGNSCQLAQGIVNDLTSGMDLKNKTDQSLVGTAKGFFSDFFESKQQTGGTSPTNELKTRDPDAWAKLVGNVVWKQLKENSAQYWFTGGDNELLEAIMSLTGTVIVQEPEEDPDQPGGSSAHTQPISTLPGKKISLADFINGGKVNIYSCSADTTNCMTAGPASGGTKDITIKGVKDQIWDILLGPMNQSGTGIVGKFARNTGTLTPSEKAFMSNMPYGMGAIVRNLSVLSEDGARQFVQESAGSIALVMSYNFVEEFFRAGRTSLASSKSPFIKVTLDLIQESHQAIRSEYSVLLNQYGAISDQVDKYNSLLTNLRKQRYMLTTLTGQAK